MCVLNAMYFKGSCTYICLVGEGGNVGTDVASYHYNSYQQPTVTIVVAAFNGVIANMEA